MQTGFSTLPLNKEQAVLAQALKMFYNFSGQHLYKQKENEIHALLDLQAPLEWNEKDRMNIISFTLSFNLPCLFSAFSLPPTLFNRRDEATKTITYFHNWTLQSEEELVNDSEKVNLVDSKRWVVFKGGWESNQPCGESIYALSKLYYLKGEISNLLLQGRDQMLHGCK